MPSPNRYEVTRRWWQHAVRAALLTVLALFGLYVTLPVWAPTGLLKRRLASQMSAQMGVAVQIGRLSLTWSGGVELRDLRIASPEGFSDRPMVVVERICAELAPLKLLVHQNMGWVKLIGAEAFVEIDRGGNVNVSALKKLNLQPGAERLSVQGGGVAIQFSDEDRLLRVRVQNAEYVAGRLHQLGQVTVLAVLDQKDLAAPVSMQCTAGAGERAIAADALFNFANVDVEQLGLLELLSLPLRKLSGRCRGSVNLRVDREGVVDQFGFQVSIHNLDVQPVAGPKLPVIEDAGFRISAVINPITDSLDAGELNIQSASVVLPGLELAGRASVSTDIIRGNWEAVRNLELQGRVHPTRLAALLGGPSQPLGGLKVDESLAVRLAVNRDGDMFNVAAAADATLASISLDDEPIKAAGCPMEMVLRAALDRRNWHLRVEKGSAMFRLADNTFRGGGTVRDLRALVEVLRPQAGVSPDQAALKAICLLDWDGQCEIRQLPPLRHLTRPLGDPLASVRLDGAVEGKLSVRQSAGTQVQVDIAVPSETHLAIGDVLVKEGRDDASGGVGPLNVGLVAKIGEQSAVERFDIDLGIDGGRLSMDGGAVKIASAGGFGGWSVQTAGRFSAVEIGSLLACFAGLGGSLDGRIEGRIEGQYGVMLGDVLSRLSVEADLKELGVDWPGLARKPAGEPGKLTVELSSDQTSTADARRRASLTAEFPRWKLLADASYAKGWAPASPGRAAATLKVDDATCLTDTLPVLQEKLSVGSLSGSLRLDVAANWATGQVDLRADCNADGVEFVSTGESPATKAANVPLRVSMVGCAAKAADGQTEVKIDQADVRLAGSRLSLSGRAILGFTQEVRGPAYLEGMLSDFQVRLEGRLAADQAAMGLVPQLRQPVGRYGVTGTLGGAVSISGDRQGLTITSQLDAGALGIQQAGPFVKPPGVPTEIELACTAPVDLWRVRVDKFHLKLPGVSLVAEGQVLADRSQPAAAYFADRLANTDADLSVKLDRAESLAPLAPSLKPYCLSGQALLDCRLEWDGGSWPKVTWGRFRSDGLGGKCREKDVLVAGQVSLRDVRPGQAGAAWIGQFQTDGLELRVGENHCWLTADLSGLPDQVGGTFHLLADRLDEKDLKDWLQPAGQAERRSAGSPPGGGKPSIKLTAEQQEKLLARAEGLIADCRPYVRSAAVNGQVSIEGLRTFDPSVRQYYDTRHLEARLSADGGRVVVNSAAGLNGGTIRHGYDVRLDEPAPMVACRISMRDVVGTQGIQPQLAKYFPGNTVSGVFDRQEESTIPLRDLLANGLDYRYALHPIGSAKTITTDGLLEGRAAPRFIAQLFPGLNLARYRYNKMTGFATFRPDGVAENDMVFSGKTYDIYIDGTTDAQNIGCYDIGLILLGTPQSPEWNHRYRQGRLPILKLKARIEGGKMYDEVVSYPWPNESLGAVLVKNNIFYRIWLASRTK